MQLHTQSISGNWKEGFALDLHTISSSPIQEENNSNESKDNSDFQFIQSWDTTRTEFGEMVFQLKYRNKIKFLEPIANIVSDFLLTKSHWQFQTLIPIPPSNKKRRFQPVREIARTTAEKLNLPFDETSLRKIRSTAQLKQVEDYTERMKILSGAFEIDDAAFLNRDILVLDDLYRSGATLNEVCKVLTETGKARSIFVITLTKTRSKR